MVTVTVGERVLTEDELQEWERLGNVLKLVNAPCWRATVQTLRRIAESELERLEEEGLLDPETGVLRVRGSY